jgi:putative transposase
MPEGGYKIRNAEGVHFVTFAVVEWVDVFTRKEYRDILLESIVYCQKEKGLLLHACCIMSNRVHLVISAANNNPSDVLRDFKNIQAKKSLKLSQRIIRKAVRTGC